MEHGITSWLTAGCTLVMLSATTAMASDYSHLCETIDGTFVMENEALFETGAHRAGSATALPYTLVSKTVEAEETGYCTSWAKEATGRRFDFQYRRYIQRIAFQFGGAKRNLEMHCTLEADGLPANFACDRRVITHSRGVVDKIPTAASLWEHNGSTLALVIEGDQHRLIYREPREGLVANGVRPGTLLFDGQSDGYRYQGRARIFTRSCGELSYAVSGSIKRGGARIVLLGKVPRLDAACRLTGWADDRLVFDLKNQQPKNSAQSASPDTGQTAVSPASIGKEPLPPQRSALVPPPLSPQMQAVAAHFGQGCEAVALPSWSHPALAVIRKRKQARLEWAMLCRNQRHPVFAMTFDYDPQGRTSDFFIPLYDDVLQASGGAAFSFVSLRNKQIIDVAMAGKNQIDVNFRDLPQLPPAENPERDKTAPPSVHPTQKKSGPPVLKQKDVRLFLGRASFSTPEEWEVRADPDQAAIGFIRPDKRAEIIITQWPKARPMPSEGVKQLEHLMVADTLALRYRQKIENSEIEHIFFENSYPDGSRISVSYRASGEPIEDGAPILELFLADLILNDSPPGGWSPVGPLQAQSRDPYDGIDMNAFEKTR